MAGENRMDLRNNDSYIKSCLAQANDRLSRYRDIEEIKKDQDRINAYKNINSLKDPKDIFILDSISKKDIARAKKCVLEGRFFSEHAAAGEATRLSLGTKYIINLGRDFSAEMIADMISSEKGIKVTEADVISEAGCRPDDIESLQLGTRHMLQFSFDISRLAREEKIPPEKVLARQKMLIILNEATAKQIIDEFTSYDYFGFSRQNVFFMIQRSYHGISRKGDRFIYDTSSPKRLHNHGQMVMQQTMDDEIFFIRSDGSRHFLKSREYGDMLRNMDDKQSFNIEDLGFLLESIDYNSLAMALGMSDRGYRMVMEIVANNPKTPQKGGMAAFDKILKRNVMIEGFQLMGIKNSDIRFLNRNFNHYPKPYDSWAVVKKNGLNMPIVVKDGLLYFQPVQGDINFLVKTEFVQRKVLKPIRNWKSPATTPLTIGYMKEQDRQPGFLDYAARITGSTVKGNRK